MDEFIRMGVNVTEATGHGLGAVTAIMINENGTLNAAADERRGGSSIVNNGTSYP
jgi:gamma-glutamyltranspeptidase